MIFTEATKATLSSNFKDYLKLIVFLILATIAGNFISNIFDSHKISVRSVQTDITTLQSDVIKLTKRVTLLEADQHMCWGNNSK